MKLAPLSVVIAIIMTLAAPVSVRSQGFFTVSAKDGHYYFEIPDSLYGREMMVITRLKRAPFGITTEGQEYGGEKVNEQVWKWQRHASQVFIWVHDYSI